MTQHDINVLPQTFNLLEDLARRGITRVSINIPPPERATCSLSGVFALIPVTKKGVYPSSALWVTLRRHGGMSCGNGLGHANKEKTLYWCQGQNNRDFSTGHFEWVGQETNDYRKWRCEELIAHILDIQ